MFVRSKEDKRKYKICDKKIYKISSKSGYGVRKLIKAIKKNLIKADNEKIPLFSRERHIQKILAWREKPDEFMKELVQEPIKPEYLPLQQIFKDKLTSLGIK